ncbi:MAG: helix-turn-helix domain-containing protein [Parachlamydiales bacterium]|jgi:cytoskeletal protein RodZ|nr:helix-turn-helix domain-containing protein [Verrucomicrobiota bacterium]MBX3719685.1 helix-turn-helix domain-containing protein [Candidatus Acheromyda pituitae]
MSEELKRVGAMFKSKRKELNLSLKEVENSTSIRSSYLEAIEEGRIQQFISGVYALGFMKQYANFLGIDMDTMIRENPHIFRMPAEKHEFSYGIGTLEVRGSMGGGVKWLPNLLWAGAAALVLVVAWYLAKFLGVI